MNNIHGAKADRIITDKESPVKTFTYEMPKLTPDDPRDFAMDVRVVELEGEPWFVAKDIAVLLGYVNAPEAVRKFCKKQESLRDLIKVSESRTLHPQTKLIPESDLYRLVLRSDMPEAERFQDWICEEVIPTIRKTGGTYMTDDALEKTFEDPDYMIGVLKKMKELKAERDHAIRTKAWIGSKREASAMGKASAATKEVKRLKEKYEDPDFMAVTAIPWLKEVFQGPISNHLCLLIGQELKAISDLHGLESRKTQGERFAITLWHRVAIKILKGRAEVGRLRPKLNV